MKLRSICIAAVALLLPTLSATQSFAAPQYVGTMRFDSLLAGNGSGGEFAWTNLTLNFTPKGQGQHGAGPNQFVTFCVEESENIGYGQTAHSFLNTKSETTGVALKAETAFLYTQFLNGTLSGYTYNTNASATSLQLAIWYLQEQIGSVGGDTQAQTWLDLADYEVHNASGSWGETIGNVRILNNWTSVSNGAPSGTALQDMLVSIPLPAPVWMAGIGLFGVIGGSVYRRRSNRSPSTL